MSSLSRYLILGLRRLRAQITSRQHARWKFASTAAISLIAAAVLLLLDGFMILGIGVFVLGGLASWLTGIWVVPGGMDGYYRKVSRVLRDTHVQSQQYYETAVKELRDLTSSIAQLSQSHGGEGSYRKIIAECKEIDGLMNNKEISFDRVHQVARHRQHLLEFGKSFGQSQADAVNQPLAEIFVRRASAILGVFDTAHELLSNQGRKLTSIRAPATLRVQHQRYIDILSAYVSALGDVCKVVLQDSESSRDENLVAVASARHQEWREFTQIYSDELRRSWIDPTRGIGRVSNAT